MFTPDEENPDLGMFFLRAFLHNTHNALAIFTRGGSIDKVERYEITIREN